MRDKRGTQNAKSGKAGSLRGRWERSEFRVPSSGFAPAFTLIEIVISLTVMALIVGAAVPSIRGIIREQQALEPLNQLAEMVRTTRDRAIRLQRPYQIGLDSTGCYASPFFPHYQGTLTYDELKNEVDALRQENEATQASAARFGIDPATEETPPPNAPGAATRAPSEPDDLDFLPRYNWPDGYRVSVRFWKDPQWELLEGALSKLWVIQSSGISLPVLIRFEADGVLAEARFDPLTGEMDDVHSSVR